MQVFRNLDCLRAICASGQNFYVLLIVDEGGGAHRAAASLDEGVAVARQSWPHLNEEQADELYRRYLGVTTWTQVVGRFSDQTSLKLPHDVQEAEKMGLSGTCVWL
jgi:hypothetical protein